MEINIDKAKIRKVKEDINLAMFNNPQFSLKDMKCFNQIMEGIENAKINLN